MKFLPLALSALVAVSSASPIIKRDSASDATAIVSSLSNIVAKVTTLNNTLNTFKAKDPLNLFTALKIQKQSNDVGSATDSAISTAQASGPLDDAGSLKVALATLSLSTTLKGFLANIESKKPAFDSILLGLVSLSQTTKATLVKQKGQADQLGAVIASKLTPAYQGLAPGVQSQIDGYFDHAIAVYSQPGGVISLPPLSLGKE
ncbi:hypothetical protein LTR95_007179 [Oleoguttula sp. CCFEE 5521]